MGTYTINSTSVKISTQVESVTLKGITGSQRCIRLVLI